MRDLLFIGAWLALVPIAFAGADLGVMLWAWTSLLGPNDILWGIGIGVPFAKVAALLTCALLVVRSNEVQFRLGRTGWLLLALAFGAILSQSMSTMIDTDSGWGLCQRYLKVLALGMVVLWTITDRLRIHGLLLAICLGVGYIGVDEGAKFILSGSGHKVLGSPSLGDNNQIALDLLLIIPLLQYLYSTAANRALRVACGGGIVLSVVAVIATFSRGGFVGLVVVAFGSVLASRRKGLSIVLLAVALLVGGALVGSDWTDRMSTVQTAEDDSSFLGRVNAWKVSTLVALDRPFLGDGFHAIQHFEVWMGQAGNFSQFDFIPSGPQGTFPRAAHSIWFEVLGDLGMVGLLCFASLLAVAWFETGQVRRMVKRSGRVDLAWAGELALKLRVSLAAFAVSGSFLSAAYFDIDYLLISLASVLHLLVSRAVKQTTARGGSTAASQPRFAPPIARPAAAGPGWPGNAHPSRAINPARPAQGRPAPGGAAR